MLLLILATNVYLVWRMSQILPTAWLKILVPALYVLTLVTYICAFMGVFNREMLWVAKLNTFCSPILIIYLYSLLAFLILDLGRLVRLVPKDFAVSSLAGSAVVFGAVALLLAIGAVNYRHKHRETLEITTSKSLEKPLKIVMASDLHLGYNNSRKTLARWIDMINAENPDLVIFGGDIIDSSVIPLFRDNFAAEFRRLTAPAFGAFGNHEFISNGAGSLRFYREAGITPLRDSVAHVHGIAIIGRDDLYAGRMGRGPRRTVEELKMDINPSEFTILVDHQPYHLEEAEAAGVDFQFSGHTHRGQVWPISLLTDFMYEKSWGHHQRGSTRYYISSGLGIWGPKIRIGSRSEYLVLTIQP